MGVKLVYFVADKEKARIEQCLLAWELPGRSPKVATKQY
jgi:hypothetical protein